MTRLLRVGITDVRASLHASIGDIAFGMEDGAVSIAGLVFGVAASTSDSHIVLLAGATGAVAGAVSMMAGTYLDVQSSEDRARARVAALEARVHADPTAELAVMGEQLGRAGLSDEEIAVVTNALARNPGAVARYAAAFELGRGQHAGESPLIHALWMFAADICAAAIPVIPFALFDIGSARVASLAVTTALLLALGIGRGIIARKSVLATAAQTLAIAGAAALAGIAIGKLVSS
jgi:VIT1/CCC1 family predicted Fe2+/Mn2+ transporter